LYYKVRREWDGIQAESEMNASDHARKISELRRIHEDEIANLQSKIQMLQIAVDDSSQVERLRATQREKTELELRVKSLVQELDEIRFACKLIDF